MSTPGEHIYLNWIFIFVFQWKYMWSSHMKTHISQNRVQEKIMFAWYTNWKWKHVHLCSHIYICLLHVKVNGMVNVSLIFLITVRKVNLKQNIGEETSWLPAKYYEFINKYLCNKQVSLANLMSLSNTKLCKKILLGGNQNKTECREKKKITALIAGKQLPKYE